MSSVAADLFNQLYVCLRSQEGIIDRLIAAGGAQIEALWRNNLDELYKTVQEQQSCAAEMEKAEQQRLSLQESLENTLNIDKGTTLSKLLPFASEMKSSLQQQLTILQEKIKKFKEINIFNSKMIKKVLMVNSRLIQILDSGAIKTYGIKGEIESNLQRVSVLNRSV